jgi:hypothetical protein
VGASSGPGGSADLTASGRESYTDFPWLPYSSPFANHLAHWGLPGRAFAPRCWWRLGEDSRSRRAVKVLARRRGSADPAGGLFTEAPLANGTPRSCTRIRRNYIPRSARPRRSSWAAYPATRTSQTAAARMKIASGTACGAGRLRACASYASLAGACWKTLADNNRRAAKAKARLSVASPI